MAIVLLVLKFVMAAFFLFAGIMHFKKPKFFLRIIPPILPFKEALNYISGAAEIIFAIMLVIPATTILAAWGIIALLIAVFPANVYHLMAKGAGMKVPIWALWLRLPMQGLLIYWAYQYTMPL
jgi:uncharacterized membrane protein